MLVSQMVIELDNRVISYLFHSFPPNMTRRFSQLPPASFFFDNCSTILSLEGVGKPHINIRWSDDGSDENERVYRYRLDCGLIVSARGTPQPSGVPPRDFHKKVADLRLCCALDHQTTAGTLRSYCSITP